MNVDVLPSPIVRMGAKLATSGLRSQPPGLPPVGSITSGGMTLKLQPFGLVPLSKSSVWAAAGAATARAVRRRVREWICIT